MSTRSTAPLTVREAIELPALRRGRPRAVAGSDRLDNTIRWVHVAEVAGIARLLHGGELLLTTGQTLKASATEQRRFITTLAATGVSGLVLELGPHMREPPAVAVAAAASAGVPFVVLDREIRFVDVTEELHRRLLERQFFVLRRAEELDRALTGLVVAGGGVSAVVEALADSLGAPVTLRGEHDEIVHASTGAATGGTGRAAAPGEDAGDDHAIEVRGARGPAGRLLITSPGGRPDPYELLAARRAASVIALLVARADHEVLLALRERGSFLQELAEGRVARGELEPRARSLGLPSRGARLLPIAVMVTGTEADLDLGLLASLVRALAAGLGSAAMTLGAPAGADRLLGLMPIPRGRTRAAAAGAIAAAIHRESSRLFGKATVPVVVVGPEVTSLEESAEALRMTLDAVLPSAEATPRAWHDATEADLERLLASLRSDERVMRFAEARLREVIEHDARSRSPLLPTLTAMVEAGGNRTAAARALGIRRQSLYGRIERIERLLGESLDRPRCLLEIELALAARRP